MKKLCSVVAAVFLFSAMGQAQALGFKGVGGSVGYVNVSYNPGLGLSSESLSGFVIGAHVDMGQLSPSFQLIPDLQYWSVSKEYTPGYNYKISDFSINGNLHYNIAMEGSLKPYLGAGLGINFYSFTTEQPTTTVPLFGTVGGNVSESATRLGINLIVGANFPMSSFTIFPEVRYVISSDVNHFIIKVGATFPLRK